MTKKFIHAGWLLDGSGGPVQEQVLLHLERGRITQMEPFSPELGIRQEELADFSHCTLLPPLVDSHIHLFMSATTDLVVRKKQLAASYEELLPAIRQHMEDLFSHGVLAVRDGGDYGSYASRYGNEKKFSFMTVKTAGHAWHRQDHYGRLISKTPESFGTSDLADAFLLSERQQEGLPADFVKIIQSGIVDVADFHTQIQPQFSFEELRRLVAVAEECGKKVMAHANGEEPVRRVIEAGCHSLEHGFFMGEENLKRLADSRCVWVPTVYTMRGLRANLNVLGEKAKLSVLDRILDHQLNQLRRARELGVKVALGTDAGSLGTLHGEAVVEEMRLYKKAGYTLSETVYCSSVQGAALLGLDDVGKIRVGGPATFLVSRGTPSQLPRKLLYLEGIFIAGKQAPSSPLFCTESDEALIRD